MQIDAMYFGANFESPICYAGLSEQVCHVELWSTTGSHNFTKPYWKSGIYKNIVWRISLMKYSVFDVLVLL